MTEILEFAQTVIVRDRTIDALNTTVEQKNGSIADLQRQWTEQNNQIVTQASTIAQQSEAIIEKTTEAANAVAAKLRHYVNVQNRNASMTDRDEIISQKDHIIAERDALITTLLQRLLDKNSSANPDPDPDPDPDCIHMDGTYYFDLGEHWQRNLGFELDFLPVEKTGDAHFGISEDTDMQDFRLFFCGMWYFDYAENRYTSDYCSCEDRIKVTYKNGYLTIPGYAENEPCEIPEYETVNTEKTLLLGGSDMFDTTAVAMDFYSLKLYVGDELIRHYVPKDGNLYEKFTGTTIEPTFL